MILLYPIPPEQGKEREGKEDRRNSRSTCKKPEVGSKTVLKNFGLFWMILPSAGDGFHQTLAGFYFVDDEKLRVVILDSWTREIFGGWWCYGSRYNIQWIWNQGFGINFRTFQV